MTSTQPQIHPRASEHLLVIKIVRVLFSVLLLTCLAFPPSALAKSRGGGKRKPYVPPYDAIVALDTSAKTITIGHVNSKDTTTVTYKLTDDVEIQVNNASATINDLQVGMKVQIGQGMVSGTVERIAAMPAPTPK